MKTIKNLLLCFFTLIFCVGIAWSQCPTGNITLTSQQEINDFVAQYPDCSEVPDNLAIRTSAVNDLSPLTQLTSVGGRLAIERTHVTDMTGLNNLTSVGTLNVGGNDSLINLIGLESLSTANWLSVGYFSPTDDFFGNPALTSLDGLDNLTSVPKGLEITGNFVLTDLTSLHNLSIIQDIIITLNSSLVNLNGLENLTSIKNLSIGANPSLTDLTAFNGFISVRNIVIIGNDNLSNLSGLKDIAHSIITNLIIYENSSLFVCNYPNICDYLENSGTAEIHDNAPDCNSVEEILALCTVSTTTPNQPNITISPNPNTGIFTIQGIPNVTYQILNASGQIIQQGEMKDDVLLDISDVAQGVYFISVTIDDETFVKRIVKI